MNRNVSKINLNNIIFAEQMKGVDLGRWLKLCLFAYERGIIMDNRLKINEETLNLICEQEAKKIVGKVCKRFELSNDKEAIKSQVKELLYEFVRDLRDTIRINGKEAINLTIKK